MGGGGTMRAAAKIAGIGGVVQSGLRGSQSVPPVEQAVRKASFPASAAIASSSSVNAATAEVSPIKKSSSWDWDDWEFAGGEDKLVMSAGEPMPRVVFTGVPTLEEAKEATSELKDALDKVFLSNNECSETEETSAADKVCAMSLSSDSDSETKSLIVSETSITPSVPKHALQAFRVLSKNTNAQNVVASIACDPNVWNAVLQNSAVKEFFESQQKTSSEVHLLEYQGPESCGKFEDSSRAKQSRDFEDGLKDLLQNIKLTVDEMILVSCQSISSRLDDLKKLNLLVVNSKGLVIFSGPLNHVSSWCQNRINWDSLDLSSASSKLRSTVDLGSSKLRSTVDFGSAKLRSTVDLGSAMSTVRSSVDLGTSKLRSSVDVGSTISALRSTIDLGSSKLQSTMVLGSSKLGSTVDSIMGNLYKKN